VSITRVLFVIQQVDYEPQGLLHLSSALKQAGHEVDLVISKHQDPVEVARKWQPGIVAYSVMTGSQHYYLELNRRIREVVPAFSVFGGPHPTFFPEMIEEAGVDGICIGEGEEALVDLANALSDGGLNPEIPNWHFKLDGEIIRNPVRPAIMDLDTLPLPDRDLLYSRDVLSRKSKIKHFITSRGCPYNCTYCFNHALFEIYGSKARRFRQRSVDDVIEEINKVRTKYPLEFVVFVDDTFVVSQEWLRELAEKFPRDVGLPFFCNTRANLVTKDQVQLLKKAGSFSVSMGVEAGNDRVRNEILKRGMTREHITNAARLFHEAGLHFTTTNIIGLPGTTIENDLETLDLNIECQPDYAHVFIFQPYPRTQLGEFARDQDLMVGTFNDIGELAWDTSVLKFPPEHLRQLENLQRFFALVVNWPSLRPLLLRVVKWRPNQVFWLINKLWKGYVIKKRVHPVRLTLREYVDIIWHFMKIRS
jgi:anaerobic magnesium-protoporphyrin IX monomethyl ester cyclase